MANVPSSCHLQNGETLFVFGIYICAPCQQLPGDLYGDKSPESSDAIIKIDRGEFEATLRRAGLDEIKAKAFLERVTFQSGRRDLYDAPLLLTSDGEIFFVTALYRGVDIVLIICSQIGSQKLNVNSKGRTFEKAVLKMFQDAGLHAKTFAFTIKAISYDCDVAVLWDQHLFIFECKNYPSY